MAPEQAISNIESIDERTDIYGLGAILYFILTKEHPNRGENAKDALCRLVLDVRESTKHASSSPIPKKLAAICDRALAKRKDERFQSVAELSAAVRAARVEHLKGATLKVVAALVLDCCVLPFLVSL
jgi:serine/threonine protein kinase